MLLFIYRLILQTITFFFLLLPLMLIGAIILPFVCPFISKDELQLPALFRWWDNADSYLNRDTSAYKTVCQAGWWSRYCYIAWRNPINYFDYLRMGLIWRGNEVYTTYNPDEDNIGDGFNQIPGWRHIEVNQNGKKYWEYYLIYVYPFNKKVCFRWRSGYKIKDKNNPTGTITQWCLVLSPWKEYDGLQSPN